jgi:hypothetical protein
MFDEALVRRRAPRQAQSARPRENLPALSSMLSGYRTLRSDRSSTEAPGPYLARRRCSRSPGGRVARATPRRRTPPRRRRLARPRSSARLGRGRPTRTSPSRQDRRPRRPSASALRRAQGERSNASEGAGSPFMRRRGPRLSPSALLGRLRTAR